MSKTCTVPGCGRSLSKWKKGGCKERKPYTFRTQKPNIRQQWREVINTEYKYKSSYVAVCDIHFTPKDFFPRYTRRNDSMERPPPYLTNLGRKTDAVPSLYLDKYKNLAAKKKAAEINEPNWWELLRTPEKYNLNIDDFVASYKLLSKEERNEDIYSSTFRSKTNPKLTPRPPPPTIFKYTSFKDMEDMDFTNKVINNDHCYTTEEMKESYQKSNYTSIESSMVINTTIFLPVLHSELSSGGESSRSFNNSSPLITDEDPLENNLEPIESSVKCVQNNIFPPVVEDLPGDIGFTIIDPFSAKQNALIPLLIKEIPQSAIKQNSTLLSKKTCSTQPIQLNDDTTQSSPSSMQFNPCLKAKHCLQTSVPSPSEVPLPEDVICRITVENVEPKASIPTSEESEITPVKRVDVIDHITRGPSGESMTHGKEISKKKLQLFRTLCTSVINLPSPHWCVQPHFEENYLVICKVIYSKIEGFHIERGICLTSDMSWPDIRVNGTKVINVVKASDFQCVADIEKLIESVDSWSF